MASRTSVIETDLVSPRITQGFGVYSLAKTVAAEEALAATYPPYLFLDPNGADRTVLLPTEASFANKQFFIRNTGSAGETLTVEEDSSTTAVAVIEYGQGATVYCDGTSWFVIGTMFDQPTSTVGITKVVKVALTAATDTTAGGVLSWANPEGQTILVTRVIFNITTASSGAATLDVGVAANGTTSSDTLMDALNVNSAVICADNIENQGTNGGSVRQMTSTQYITATASATTAGMVGSAYIMYMLA